MMVKKIILVMLLFCFLNITLTPHFVHALTDEEQAESDAKLVRLVLGLAGLALLAYIFEHGPFSDKLTSEKTITFPQESKPRLIDFKFSLTKLNMMPDENNNPPIRSYDEMLAPALELIVRF